MGVDPLSVARVTIQRTGPNEAFLRHTSFSRSRGRDVETAEDELGGKRSGQIPSQTDIVQVKQIVGRVMHGTNPKFEYELFYGLAGGTLNIRT